MLGRGGDTTLARFPGRELWERRNYGSAAGPSRASGGRCALRPPRERILDSGRSLRTSRCCPGLSQFASSGCPPRTLCSGRRLTSWRWFCPLPARDMGLGSTSISGLEDRSNHFKASAPTIFCSHHRTSLYWCLRMCYLQNRLFLLFLDRGDVSSCKTGKSLS